MTDAKIGIKITADTSEADGKIAGTASEVDKLKAAEKGLTPEAKAAGEGIKQQGAAADEAAGKTEKHSAATKDAEGFFSRYKVAILAAVAALVTFGKQIVGAILENENLDRALKLATGSTEAMAEAQKLISGISQQLGFDQDELTKQFILLKNSGIDPSAGALENIATITKAVGGDSQKLGEITALLTKSYIDGSVGARDLQQATQQGIPIIRELAKVTGVSEAGVLALAEAGKIGRDVLVKAFAETARSMADLAKESDGTLGDSILRLKTSFANLQDDIDASQIGDGLREAFAGASSVMIEVGKNFDTIANTAVLAGNTIAASIGVKAVQAIQAKVAATVESLAASKLAVKAAQDEAFAADSLATAELAEARARLASVEARNAQVAIAARLAAAEVQSLQASRAAALEETARADAVVKASISLEQKELALQFAAAAEQRYAAVTAELTIAEGKAAAATGAHVAVVRELAAAQTAQIAAAGRAAVAAGVYASSINTAAAAAARLKAELLSLNGALNLLLAGFVGFQIGKFLHDEFEVARVAGVAFVEFYVRLFEGLRRGWEELKAIFTDDTLDEALKRHKERLAEIDLEFGALVRDATDAGRAATEAADKARAAAEEQLKKQKDLTAEFVATAAAAQAVGTKSESMATTVKKAATETAAAVTTIGDAANTVVEDLGTIAGAMEFILRKTTEAAAAAVAAATEQAAEKARILAEQQARLTEQARLYDEMLAANAAVARERLKEFLADQAQRAEAVRLVADELERQRKIQEAIDEAFARRQFILQGTAGTDLEGLSDADRRRAEELQRQINEFGGRGINTAAEATVLNGLIAELQRLLAGGGVQGLDRNTPEGFGGKSAPDDLKQQRLEAIAAGADQSEIERMSAAIAADLEARARAPSPSNQFMTPIERANREALAQPFETPVERANREALAQPFETPVERANREALALLTQSLLSGTVPSKFTFQLDSQTLSEIVLTEANVRGQVIPILEKVGRLRQ